MLLDLNIKQKDQRDNRQCNFRTCQFSDAIQGCKKPAYESPEPSADAFLSQPEKLAYEGSPSAEEVGGDVEGVGEGRSAEKDPGEADQPDGGKKREGV